MTTPLKKHFSPLDDEERLLMEAIDNDEFKEIPNMEASIQEHMQIAKNTLNKKAINIRLAQRDISEIKTIALQE